MNKAQSAAEWFVVDGSGDTLTATGPFTQAVAGAAASAAHRRGRLTLPRTSRTP